jgi:DNA invertase Pin-like site-specific DNA recombinase
MRIEHAQETRAKAPNETIVGKSTAASRSCPENRFDGINEIDRIGMRVAVYARYSTDGQKETSIDDQVRCAEETAKRYGLTVSKSLIFSDDAITGAAKATHKREQYHALRAAVCAGQVDVIVCDQQCRLARSAKEALTFFDELKAHKVRLLTADGFDSEHATSQLLFGIKSVFSEFFLEETRHRVCRGMHGEFERGAMVTAVPYGYEVGVVRSAKAGRCVWVINAKRAEVVREVFRLRKEGKSFSQIAAVLNGRSVATPSEGKKRAGRYWRATALWRLIQNPIYKGLYVVNFSGEKGGRRPDGLRLMPELALVSTEAWDVCQPQQAERSAPSSDQAQVVALHGRGRRGDYGGGKHPLASVFRCGTCGACLSCHNAKSGKGTMSCVQCGHATQAGVSGRKPQHLSIEGVRQMLHWLLQKVLSGEAIERYRQYLRERLAGGRDSELALTRQALERVERSRERIGRLLRQVGDNDPVLEQEFIKVREEILHLQRKVAVLEAGRQHLNGDVIRKQLDIDLSQVVDAFLSDQNAPERTRTLLKRVFPSIVLMGKTNRYTAIFRVEVRPGAILAEASNTAELPGDNEVIWVRLKTSGSKSPTWTVEALEPPADEAPPRLM